MHLVHSGLSSYFQSKTPFAVVASLSIAVFGCGKKPDTEINAGQNSSTASTVQTTDQDAEVAASSPPPPTQTMASASPTQGFVDGNTGTLQTMVSTTFELPADANSSTDPNATWSIESTTSPEFDCTHLIASQTPTSVTLLLPGNANPQCADELKLTVTHSSVQQQSTMLIQVVETPGRVTDFKQLAGNPQPEINTCPNWDCLNHADPTLGQLPSGELAVWFAAGGDRSEGKPVVGRAVQTNDSGWALDSDPVMTAAQADATDWDPARETPTVRWNAAANAWDMWFLGYRENYHVDPGIGHTRSLNQEGTRWKRGGEPVYRPSNGAWDETFLTSPSALEGSDGRWRLYFVGASTKTDALMRVGMLESTDGQSWTAHPGNPVFEGVAGKWDANILDTHVQFVGGRYVMWYSALPGQLTNDSPIAIGVAVSEDGLQWQRIQDAPIISAGDGWMNKNALDVEVLQRADGSLLMAGYGHSTIAPNPAFPDFHPGRIGFWVSNPSE